MTKRPPLVRIILFVIAALLAATQPASAEPLKVGIIGLDTSHAVHFTRVMNDAGGDTPIGQCKVVAAYRWGTREIPAKVEKGKRNAKKLKAMGVDMVDSIDALLERVDAVMLETVDGRPHLRQALPVIEAGKPLFVDKPLAHNLTDAVAIYQAAENNDVPIFSSSSLRYIKGMDPVQSGEAGRVLGAMTYSPASLQQWHTDLFWYAIHAAEPLFTAMGTGCEKVRRVHTEDTDLVVGVWADGRIGTLRGRRSGEHNYGGIVFTSKKEITLGPYNGYKPLVKEIARFFQSREAPVKPAMTLEIYAFMQAADASKKQDGAMIELATVMQKARSHADQRLKEVRAERSRTSGR